MASSTVGLCVYTVHCTMYGDYVFEEALVYEDVTTSYLDHLPVKGGVH